MGLIDRFTRDDVSAKVWWPFALLFVVLAVASFRMENLAIEERKDDAAVWASAVIRDRLEPAASSSNLTRPLGEADGDALTAALASVLVEDPVDAVRIWGDDDTLLYSSSADDVIGSQEALNDRVLEAARREPSATITVTSDRSLTGAQTDPLLLAYAAFSAPSTAVGELQLSEGALLADIEDWWMRVRVALALGAVLTLGLAVASMREPVAPIGAGVKFYPESLPASFVVVDREEISLHEKSKQPTPRSKAQERKVEELEAANLALEGELQRALSSLAALRAQRPGPPRVIPPVPSSSGASLPEAPLAEIEDLTGPAPEVEPVRLRAVPEPEPVTADTPEPVLEVAKAPEPELTEVIKAPEPEPEVAKAPEPEPEVAKAPEPEPEVALVPEPEPEPEPVVVDEPEPARDVVVIPEAEPEPQPVAQRGSRSKDEAVDVLNRLVAPSPSPTNVDPGEIRAKLARTAALKKPGSRERREEQERRSRTDPDADTR